MLALDFLYSTKDMAYLIKVTRDLGKDKRHFLLRLSFCDEVPLIFTVVASNLICEKLLQSSRRDIHKLVAPD